MYDFEERRRERDRERALREAANMAEKKRLHAQAHQLADGIRVYYKGKIPGDFCVDLHENKVILTRGCKELVITVNADDTYALEWDDDRLSEKPNVHRPEEEQNLQKDHMMDRVDTWCLSWKFP